MYRAVSPYYYTQDPKGNMYAYNDAMWLGDQLKGFAATWQSRENISPRAYGMLKLDPDIKALDAFGKRAYKTEMNTQRTVLVDLLGGAQNFLQQEDIFEGELENSVDAIIEYIQQEAASWKEILPYSTWASAVGTLVNTVATKIINDVFDLSDLGVDEAERTAQLISRITTLDSLFLQPKNDLKSQPQSDEGESAPTTAQYAENWLKIHFLSEVLQSNLKDIRFLWFESHLSLYFSKEEVVDLINLSFENNAGVRALIKDIKEKPVPRVE